MQFRKFLAAICIIAVGLASSASAVSLPVGGLKIDLGEGGTLADWTEWSGTGNLTVSGITFSMSGDDIDAARTNAGGDAVVTDGAFPDVHPGSPGVTFTINVSNLDNGTYSLRTIHRWFFEGPKYVDIYTGQAGAGTAQRTDETEYGQYGNWDTAGSSGWIEFVVDGTDDYFKIVAGDTEPSVGEYKVVLSGFVLTPEPATVALLGMGSLALLRRRR